MKKIILSSFSLLCLQLFSFAQPDFGYNSLLTLNSTGNTEGQVHYPIGNFKVKGSPYLYDMVFSVDFFQKGTNYASKLATFDTYRQLLEHKDEANNQVIGFDVTLIDSFFLTYKKGRYNFDKTKFINATLFDTKYKFFAQEIGRTSKITIFKSYKSVLGSYGSGIQAGTGGNPYKQFNLETQYYYQLAGQKELVKISFKEKAFIKAFESLHDVSGLFLDGFGENTDRQLAEYMANK